jgi:hypothetical protein
MMLNLLTRRVVCAEGGVAAEGRRVRGRPRLQHLAAMALSERGVVRRAQRMGQRRVERSAGIESEREKEVGSG